MAGLEDHPLATLSLLWPAIMARQASEFTAAMARGLVGFGGEHEPPVEPTWVTANEVVLDLASVRLRGFFTSETGRPILVCAPFALHGAAIADIAPGHSLVEALCATTSSPVFVTDWRSAGTDMSTRAIDDYLADLNVMIDELGGAVMLIGLCQGGWIGSAYAARFPGKVRKLVLAGAPIDLGAGESALSRVAHSTPLSVFKDLVALGNGRMLGRNLFRFWEQTSLDAQAIHTTLQSDQEIDSDTFRRLAARFLEWYAWTLDLPGRYYLEVVERLYLKNELARGRFMALGKCVNLSAVQVPVFMLVGNDDDVAAPAQTLALRNLIATPRAAIRHAVAPCEHLGLFMGRRTLANEWREIGTWLVQPDPAFSDAA